MAGVARHSDPAGCANALGEAVLECWAQLSQDNQHMIFEKVVVCGITTSGTRPCVSSWPSIFTTIIREQTNERPHTWFE
jgi:hypothetical protein